ncbi:MAG TPA: integrase [Acholeplasmataceae bacterium]|nr:integrase [Acholeplasmataceae bacterium]
MAGNRSTTYNVQPFRTQQEIDDFLFALRRNKHADRDVFLFLFAINTGLRMSDIVCLRKKDITSSVNPKIIEKKTGKTRTLFLSGINDLIQSYTTNLNDNDLLFPSNKGDTHVSVNGVYQIFQKAAKLIGRNDIGTHSCRKTFGYHYYKRTNDIATLMMIFGHSSESITKRYIGITDDIISTSLIDFRLGL